MPELPEVETIVRELNKEVKGRKILDAWTDWPKIIKLPAGFSNFKKEIINRIIKDIKRRGKNILFYLSDNKIMLIHQKLTGHLLIGKWQFCQFDKQRESGLKGNQKWKPEDKNSALTDPVNQYIHVMFWLSGGKMLALSDVRKFAKIMAGDKDKILNSEDLKNLGPEPLNSSLSVEILEKIMAQKFGIIKEVLMDQKNIAGIGNIYSDEILWEARINPFKKANKLNRDEIKRLYKAIKKILNKAIKYHGDSISDYRDIYGKEGEYQNIQNVYQREGEPCRRCGTKIVRFKNKGRSGHYCPRCQK